MDGLLRVDKRPGMTSHDVVAQVRKALRTREVGHAGTLDPMATGLLVVLVGEATRLSAHLTADDKAYETTVRFGVATDSLDADGAVTERAPEGTSAPREEAVREAVRARVGPMQQVPPAVSAIKVGGVPMHERVRRGEVVLPEARAVVVHRAEVRAVREGEADLALEVSKGFYVRSYARDLSEDLGTVGHLTALRRTRSGALSVEGALDGEVLVRASRGDEEARAAVRSAVESVAPGVRWMPTATVGDDDAKALRCGKIVATDGADGVVLVFSGDGSPVCIGQREAGSLKVVRGFPSRAP